MKIINSAIAILSKDRVIGITSMKNLKIEDSDQYKMLDWEDFREVWQTEKWTKKENVKYAFDYLKDAKKIIEGLGFSLYDCRFNYSGSDQPLIISLGFESNPIVICIAPRIFEDENKDV